MQELVLEKPAAEDGIISDSRIEVIAEFQSPEALYEGLITRVHKYHPSDDISMISKAYNIARDAHKGQVRKSGEPYIIHPLYVSIILADLEMDKETIIAGLLHDVVEDTIMTDEEIANTFGRDVAIIVDGVTKLSQLSHSNQAKDGSPREGDGSKNEDINRENGTSHSKGNDREEMQAENLRKMFLAMAKDIRVIMVKLADRLHNMRTLKHMPPEKQQRIARETMDIYAPIAQRLGISKIKIELDDLSLKYLEPAVYYDLVEKIAAKKSEREAYIQSIVDEVKGHMDEATIPATVDGRIKHFFSIYKKMKNQEKTIDQIYDLFAVRIIVDSVRDCYGALGVIHELYTPIPGRFKDYIAMPKPNMYQSLHTTLIGKNGVPFEIQIRTYEMHRAAEYGIAAHWKYKEASDGKKVEVREEEKLVWLRHILEWQKDMSDNREFMNLLKSDLDLFSDSVYCFTPTGDVKDLPAGSTPIDFAYAIHSAVGNRMIGARVNGKLVPIDYVLKNGDRIEIITSQNSRGPSRDWLLLVKSTQAKSKINQWFKNELKEDNIIRGKEMLLNYFKTHSLEASEIMKPANMDFVMQKYGFKDWDSVLAAIGHGGLKEGQIVNRMQELNEKEKKKNLSDSDVLREIASSAPNIEKKIRPASSHGITVKGVDDVSVRFSKCCSPVPGDEITGFVTRGRGVSIHRTDCVNIIGLDTAEQERLIEAEWANTQENAVDGRYFAEIKIFANNRSGLLADVSRSLSEKNIDILSVNTRTSKHGIATMSVSFEVGSRQELENIIDRIRNIESIIDIERTTG